MEELQMGEGTRARWIFYSALDAKATWELYHSLQVRRPWKWHVSVALWIAVRSDQWVCGQSRDDHCNSELRAVHCIITS